MLLASEKTPALSAASELEAKRQATSLRERSNAQSKYALATVASPPTQRELHRCVVHIENGIKMPDSFLATIATYSGRVTHFVHDANFFIARNPWEPIDQTVTWAALLGGFWVVSPESFMGKPGASLKYKPAVCMKRAMYVSAAFRAENPMLWRILLEVLSSLRSLHQWTLIHSAPAWAAARVKAERQKHPTAVLGLVGHAEKQDSAHLCDVNFAFNFLAAVDTTRGSIGLGKM